MKKLLLALVLMVALESCSTSTENTVVTTDSTSVVKVDTIPSVATDSVTVDTTSWI